MIIADGQYQSEKLIGINVNIRCDFRLLNDYIYL
jgi:hypothetical protein